MSALSVIILIAVLSLFAPFALRLHKSSTAWATAILVNVVIISVYIVVRDSAPDKIGHRTDPTAKLEATASSASSKAPTSATVNLPQ